MDKQALRSDVRARRRARSEVELAGWSVLLAAHVASIPGRTLTAFVGAGGEVPTLPLLDALVADGRRVLLPITLDDMQLDWAEYTGAADLAPAAFGLLEPTGPRLGLDAIAAADVILAPALAIDRLGHRLGQGGKGRLGGAEQGGSGEGQGNPAGHVAALAASPRGGQEACCQTP